MTNAACTTACANAGYALAGTEYATCVVLLSIEFEPLMVISIANAVRITLINGTLTKLATLIQNSQSVVTLSLMVVLRSQPRDVIWFALGIALSSAVALTGLTSTITRVLFPRMGVEILPQEWPRCLAVSLAHGVTTHVGCKWRHEIHRSANVFVK